MERVLIEKTKRQQKTKKMFKRAGMCKEKNRKRIIKLMRILKKKKEKKRNEGKTDIEEREQKKVSVHKHVRFKKGNFFFYKKREKGKHAKTCNFLSKEKFTKK